MAIIDNDYVDCTLFDIFDEIILCSKEEAEAEAATSEECGAEDTVESSQSGSGREKAANEWF